MTNKISGIPEFTSDDGATQDVAEEVKQDPVEETVVDAETTDAELPAAPAEQAVEKQDDVTALKEQYEKQIQGLRNEIVGLRGQRREIKQQEIAKVEAQIDDLKDLHPDDVKLVEKVLTAKGYVTQDKAQKMFFDAVKNEELSKFLEKFPEYKPENDPNDLNWGSLQKELGLYRLPDDPRQIGQLLERAHKAIARVPSGTSVQAQKRQIQNASVGGSGAQRPSSSAAKALNPELKASLHGFSEEEMQKMAQRLADR